MESTGVLRFIRGIDLTMNDLQDDKFPGNFFKLSLLPSISAVKLKSLDGNARGRHLNAVLH